MSAATWYFWRICQKYDISSLKSGGFHSPSRQWAASLTSSGYTSHSPGVSDGRFLNAFSCWVNLGQWMPLWESVSASNLSNGTMWYSPQEQLRNREHGLFWSTTLFYLYDVFFSQVHAIAMQFQDAPLATKIDYKWVDGRATLLRNVQDISGIFETCQNIATDGSPLVCVCMWHRGLSGRPGWEQHHYGPFPESFFSWPWPIGVKYGSNGSLRVANFSCFCAFLDVLVIFLCVCVCHARFRVIL